MNVVPRNFQRAYLAYLNWRKGYECTGSAESLRPFLKSGSQPDAAMIASGWLRGREQYPFVAMNKKRVHSDRLWRCWLGSRGRQGVSSLILRAIATTWDRKACARHSAGRGCDF